MSVIALFDHEECGSESLTGAASPVMGEALQRISSCFAPDTPHAAAEAQLVSTRRSFLLSADTAHAVHPNYADKHSPTHAPKLNRLGLGLGLGLGLELGLGLGLGLG